MFAENIAPAVDTKYSAVNSVTAAVGCTTTIKGTNTHSVTFEATNSIVLDDGFVAEEGSTFYAVIDTVQHQQPFKSGSQLPPPDTYDASESNTTIHEALQIEIAPSPFTTNFQVSLLLHSEQAVELGLYDITGKLLQNNCSEASDRKGNLTMNVDGRELPAAFTL
jgi:hypothetical protein